MTANEKAIHSFHSRKGVELGLNLSSHCTDVAEGDIFHIAQSWLRAAHIWIRVVIKRLIFSNLCDTKIKVFQVTSTKSEQKYVIWANGNLKLRQKMWVKEKEKNHSALTVSFYVPISV